MKSIESSNTKEVDNKEIAKSEKLKIESKKISKEKPAEDKKKSTSIFSKIKSLASKKAK